MAKFFLIPALALTAAGCQTMTPPAAGACPIVSSSDWNAWVNAMPGPNASPRLIVTGKVTAPTGGYSYAWRDLRVMESYPVQIVADLEVIPPDGPATQALETEELRGEWSTTPPVGSVSITCGGRQLARIAPVQTAQ